MADDDDFATDDKPDDLFPVERTIDAADPVAVKKRRSRTKLEAKQSEQFWRGSLSTQVGRRELWRILESAGTFEERFACGPNGFPQTEATWFEAGQKSLGQRLFKMWLRIDKLGVLTMLEENDPAVVRRPEAPAKQADE